MAKDGGFRIQSASFPGSQVIQLSSFWSRWKQETCLSGIQYHRNSAPTRRKRFLHLRVIASMLS